MNVIFYNLLSKVSFQARKIKVIFSWIVHRLKLEITRCLVWYKNKNATIAYIASIIFITSVAAFTISSWPLWIWIFQKKLLNNFNKTQPVNLKEKYNISHHIISFVQTIDRYKYTSCCSCSKQKQSHHSWWTKSVLIDCENFKIQFKQ